MELVSIILPYYKKRKFIQKTINSILAQTYKNFEIIIIYDDENLTDFLLLESIKKADSRIFLLKNNKNIGAGLSRNVGINHSKGKFIAFIDGDDLWDKNKLELQIDYMKNKNYQITHTAYHIIDEDDKVTGLRKSKNLDYNNLINSCDVGLSTVILNKELLNIDISFPNFKTKEDYFLWLKLSKENYIFNYIDEPLSNWRKTKNSLSSSITQKIADSFRVYYHYEKNFIITIYRILILIFNFIKKSINGNRVR